MKKSRRLFIKNTALGLFSIALLNPFKQLWALTKNEPNIPPSWGELVEIARWCPTIHNLQPHQVKIISETDADLFYDPGRLLPVEDPDSIFTTIAIGVFVEHLSIAAAPFGYKVIIDHLYDPISIKSVKSTIFAKLKLVSSFEKEVLNEKLILKRRTSRIHFDGKSLNEETIYKIKKESEKFGHDFFHSSEKDIVDFIIGLNEETLFEDLGSKSTRDELDRLFRYNKKEAEDNKDGLWTKCMGFSGSLTRSVFKNHDKWSDGLRKKLLKRHYASTFKGTSTVCWFGGMFNQSDDWINCGRMLARNWLIMTNENAYIHPFGSLITNKNAYNKINTKLTQPDNPKKIWMIFRAGYSKTPTRSYRLTTNEILIK
tara:strand:+ start:19 stop:1131 length:1113 start_codon:yes stop_codon:yes gene_type:complete